MTRPARDPGGPGDPGVQAAARKALELIRDGAHVGLGSGRAASLFIAYLGQRRREGLRVMGVPTSRASAYQARKAGIPLTELSEDMQLDITVDGADEVAPNLDLLKGRGGALVRERIVAAASRRMAILVGEEKLVQRLGQRGPLPVEVIPFARWIATRELGALGVSPVLRMSRTGARPFRSDNGNIILDCAFTEPLRDRRAAQRLQQAIQAVPGVVDSGLFLDMAPLVLVGHSDGTVETLRREDRET